MYKGKVQNDLGIRTDVLNNINKSIGIGMLIRSMGPQIIVCDEIGSENDINTISYALCSGVKGIFTAHGNNKKDLLNNPVFNKMIELGLFEKILFLDRIKKGKINSVFDRTMF